ncbi:hypothetical protein V6N11_027329 [Hibiscus sabdariffa]|uniref:Auxin-responsive protein n=1 Tax=Hibiscus sabdariffa TaxID=183260 RepID=A0ABR2PGL0_9ROSI
MMKKRMSGVYGKMGEGSGSGSGNTRSSYASTEEETDWEKRPGEMLVQKRNQNAGVSSPDVRLRVVYGAVHFEIYVNSQAAFGELKKRLTA